MSERQSSAQTTSSHEIHYLDRVPVMERKGLIIRLLHYDEIHLDRDPARPDLQLVEQLHDRFGL